MTQATSVDVYSGELFIRTYSQKVHGSKFRELAEEFAKKKGDTYRIVEGGKEEDETESNRYSKMTKIQLVAELKTRGIAYETDANKDRLVEILVEADWDSAQGGSADELDTSADPDSQAASEAEKQS